MSIPRMTASPVTPYRSIRRTSDKLIFISCEGSVTEWEYFEKIINLVFVNINSKIKVINILEDVLNKKYKNRTKEELSLISSSAPENVLKKMNDFIELHKDEYNLDNHTEDEFWLIMDIDEHTNQEIIDANGISNFDKWQNVLSQCKAKNYKCAISNPFFELWLLLHFDDINDSDRIYAVNSSHSYEPTSHYRERLRELGVPLKKNKGIRITDYNKYRKDKIFTAIKRAKGLETDSKEDYPTDLGTSVYKLLNSIAEVDSQYSND